MSIIKRLSICTMLAISSGITYANTQDITGLWRSVDDKSGFSKAIIEVKKDNGIYTAKIVQVIPRPGYTPKETCEKCPTPYKDQPILGLEVIKNLKANPKVANEYDSGTVLDPLLGKVYKARLKLNDKGNRLTIRGFVGVEVIGRSQYWIRHNP